MSGRRKGLEAEREAAEALEAHGLDVRLVKRRRGRRRDVDAVILLGAGRAVTLQIKREEDARPGSWSDKHVRPGSAVMYRRNRQPWIVLAAVRQPFPAWHLEWCDLETFAAYALGGVLA